MPYRKLVPKSENRGEGGPRGGGGRFGCNRTHNVVAGIDAPGGAAWTALQEATRVVSRRLLRCWYKGSIAHVRHAAARGGMLVGNKLAKWLVRYRFLADLARWLAGVPSPEGAVITPHRRATLR